MTGKLASTLGRRRAWPLAIAAYFFAVIIGERPLE